MYHCDGYYLECSARGAIDLNDIREGKHGLLRRRQICNSNGIYPANEEACRHCVETKKRKSVKHRAGRVKCSHIEHIPTMGDIVVAGKR